MIHRGGAPLRLAAERTIRSSQHIDAMLEMGIAMHIEVEMSRMV